MDRAFDHLTNEEAAEGNSPDWYPPAEPERLEELQAILRDIAALARGRERGAVLMKNLGLLSEALREIARRAEE